MADAVTLSGTYTTREAEDIVGRMRATGSIPEDSFQTFGNTYTERLCCD